LRRCGFRHPYCGNGPMTALIVYHRAFSHRRRLASNSDLFPLQKRAPAAQHNGAADVTAGQRSPRAEDGFLRSASSDHVLRRRRHEPPRLGRSNSNGKPIKIVHAQGLCRPPSEDSQHPTPTQQARTKLPLRDETEYRLPKGSYPGTERVSENKIEIGSLPSKTMGARRNLCRFLDQLRLRHRERVGREQPFGNDSAPARHDARLALGAGIRPYPPVQAKNTARRAGSSPRAWRHRRSIQNG
jgi:hypothetical protein